MSNVKIKGRLTSTVIANVTSPNSSSAARTLDALLPCHRPLEKKPAHVAKIASVFRPVCVFSRIASFVFLSFYLKIFDMQDRETRSYIFVSWGAVANFCVVKALTLCYASPIGITKKRDRTRICKVWNVCFFFQLNVHCSYHKSLFSFIQYRENVVPLSPLSQTLHNVSPPFCFPFGNH